MATLPVEPCPVPVAAHAIAIAIPARDEADEIAACLAAIARSVERAGQRGVTVLVLVNNSRDATAANARAFGSRAIAVRVVEVTLAAAEAHAGGARRRALDLALAGLPDTGILMTTDADSRVEPGWVAANLAEIEAGADAVAGVVTLAPGIPVAIAPSRHAEWRLAQLQARLHSMIDPRPQERWPTHIWAWGASLAVTVRAYRAVGGMPAVPLAEDRAFADVLDRNGFRVRRSHAPVVVTSHRCQGRAPGGFADLLSAYADDAMPCDAALEPTAALVRRLTWRARLRGAHARAGATLCARTRDRLRLPAEIAVSRDTSFGHWWAAIEDASPTLRRERVLPATLRREIRRAERVIALIEQRARRADSAPSADAW